MLDVIKGKTIYWLENSSSLNFVFHYLAQSQAGYLFESLTPPRLCWLYSLFNGNTELWAEKVNLTQEDLSGLYAESRLSVIGMEHFDSNAKDLAV